MCYRFLDREFSVEQNNVYFTVIGQAFHELWQFETGHANARNLRVVLIHFIPDPVFWIMRVQGLIYLVFQTAQGLHTAT